MISGRILICFSVFLLQISFAHAEPSCEGGICKGQINPDQVAILAKAIFVESQELSSEHFQVSCKKESDEKWGCLVRQVSIKGEVIPPGMLWTLSIDLRENTYTIFGGF